MRALLLVLVGAAAAPAIGQQFSAPSDAPSSAAGTSSENSTTPKVDESALRFFAAQGDSQRLDAETARLRALYPNWQPPKDLFSSTSDQDPDVARMWQLFAEGKFSDIRAVIAQRQASEPSWAPPADLMAQLDQGEAARRLVNAAEAKQWASVLRIATETPGMLVCGNMDVLWRVAEAFVRTDAPTRAQDLYTYILKSCPNPEERLATVQKAMQLLSGPELDALLALQRNSPDGSPEFASLRGDLLRARVGRAAQDTTVTVSAEDITALEQVARSGSVADDALVLGWYAFRRGDAARAVDWFKLAMDRNGGPSAAEGYVLALEGAGRALQAEPIAYEWRNRGADNRAAYIDLMSSLLAASPPPRLDQSVVARFAPVVSEQKSAPGAQALGWYAYNTGQISTAASWFRNAVQWAPEDEVSAYGLALASVRLRDNATLNALVRLWGSRSERILATVSPEARRRLATAPAPAAIPVAAPVAVQAAAPPASALPARALPPSAQPTLVLPPARAPAAMAGPMPTASARAAMPLDLAPAASPEAYAAPEAYAPEAYAAATTTPAARPRQGDCAASTNAAFRTGRISPGAAVARGWCLLELDRAMEAIDAFDVATRIGAGQVAEDAAYGKSLAYLRLGLTNHAQVAAAQTSQPPARAAELSADLFAQRAIAAYRDARYVEVIIALDQRSRVAPEQQDLMMLRAWSYFHLRDFPSAGRIFRALQASGNTEAGAGINAIMATTRQWRS